MTLTLVFGFVQFSAFAGNEEKAASDVVSVEAVDTSTGETENTSSAPDQGTSEANGTTSSKSNSAKKAPAADKAKDVVDVDLSMTNAYITVKTNGSAEQTVPTQATKVSATTTKDLQFVAYANEGYELSKVEATNVDGAKVTLKEKGNGTYVVAKSDIKAGLKITVVAEKASQNNENANNGQQNNGTENDNQATESNGSTESTEGATTEQAPEFNAEGNAGGFGFFGLFALGGINVNATADAGVFPENTTMKVEKVNLPADLAGQFKAGYQAIDITFYNAEGEEIQPNGSVNVTLDGVEAIDDASIYHVTKNGQLENVSKNTKNNGKVSFSASSFSVYVYGALGTITIDDGVGSKEKSIEVEVKSGLYSDAIGKSNNGHNVAIAMWVEDFNETKLYYLALASASGTNQQLNVQGQYTLQDSTRNASIKISSNGNVLFNKTLKDIGKSQTTQYIILEMTADQMKQYINITGENELSLNANAGGFSIDSIKVNGDIFDEVVEAFANVSYSWNLIGEGDKSALPPVPAPKEVKFTNSHTEKAPAGYEDIDCADGTWIWKGWSPEQIILTKENSSGHFVGTWEWVANTYTVKGTIDNGGAVTNSDQTVNYGGDADEMAFTPATGYHITGITVNGVAQEITDVTGYTYTATNVTENVEVAVTTAKANFAYTIEYYFDGEKGAAPAGAPTSGTGEFGSTTNVAANQKVSVDEKNYALDYIEQTTITAVPTNNVVKVYYATDEIGTDDPNGPDGVPDKYQAKITYKVVNGAWNDET
ncbi:MAG: hypothetical protein ACI4BI_05275, partial [Anaerotardibacter sp.]